MFTAEEFNKISKIGPYTLVAEKLEQWEWMNRFIESNPDIKERYQRHKTYEILNDTRN